MSGLSVGDAVLALAPGSLASHVTLDARLVVPKPARLSFARAAALPVAWLTAELALGRLAKLRPGQSVLVHAATGGLGQAALRLARAGGIAVLATAGSPAKRALLRSMGIEHVFDSRRPGFAALARQATGGRGVDAVLNSLSGPLIREGLEALAEGGHFLEAGKIGIWEPGRVAEARPDVRYHAIALDALGRDEPGEVGSRLAGLVGRLDGGDLDAPEPGVVGLGELASTLRRMAQARHLGKLVVRVAGEPEGVPIRPDGTYLITGGLGALGLRVAGWLVGRGARHLVLVGRNPPGPEAAGMIAGWEAAGASVRVERADVGRPGEAAALLGRLGGSGWPGLRGVVHAAGSLDDGALAGQSWGRVAGVMGPKVGGAWGLHRATAGLGLDFFVLFGSASGTVGSAGQGGYAAGNAFLDGLAMHRRALGLPGLSVAWGPWAGQGMAARLDAQQRKRLASKGMGTIEPEQGLEILGRLIDRESPACVAVLPVDWKAYLQGGEIPPMLSPWAGNVSAVEVVDGQVEGFASRFLERFRATSPNQQEEFLFGYVREQAGRLLGIEPSMPLDPLRPLQDLGFDSLMAVELRNTLGAALGRTLPAGLLFSYPTIEALVGHIGRDLLGIVPPGPAPEESGSRPESAAEVLGQIEQISDEDVERLFRERVLEKRAAR